MSWLVFINSFTGVTGEGLRITIGTDHDSTNATDFSLCFAGMYFTVLLKISIISCLISLYFSGLMLLPFKISPFTFAII